MGLYKKDETVKTTWNSLNSTVKNLNLVFYVEHRPFMAFS